MEVFINKVITGTKDRDGNIYEYSINGVLNSGYKIEIFWYGNLDPRIFLNQTVDCLIVIDTISDVEIKKELKVDLIAGKIFGEYLGQYNIPEIWNFKHIITYDAIKTLDGIILLYDTDFSNMSKEEKIRYEIKIDRNLEIGDIISFYPEKFELLAFKQVEN